MHKKIKLPKKHLFTTQYVQKYPPGVLSRSTPKLAHSALSILTKSPKNYPHTQDSPFPPKLFHPYLIKFLMMGK